MNDIIYVYRVLDIPLAMRGEIPAGHPILSCVFFSARRGSPAIAAAFERVPEPEMDQVDYWLGVAKLASTALMRARLTTDIWPEDGSTIVNLGFHAGDAALVETAWREAGAVLRDAGPMLASIIWLIIETYGGTLYERWVKTGTVSFASVIPVREAEATAAGMAPAIYAFCPDDTTTHWTLFSEQGAFVNIGSLGAGAHRVVLEEPKLKTLDVDPPTLAQATEILRDVHATAMTFADQWAREGLDRPTVIDVAVEVGAPDPSNGRVPVALVMRAGAEPFMSVNDDLALVPEGPFDPARYRAFLEGVRDALIAEPTSPGVTESLAPLLLYADDTLQTREDFARVCFDFERAAITLAKREETIWRTLGVTGPLQLVHGTLSPAWLVVANHVSYNSESLQTFIADALAALPEPEARELRIAALQRWTQRLIANELDGFIGPLSVEIHRTLALDLRYVHGMELDAVNAVIDAAVAQLA